MTTVYWDVTSRCNADCLYCSAKQARTDASPAATPPGIARAALARLRAAGAGGVILLGGEPTLLADLEGILETAAGLGMTVGIATNGLAHSLRLRRALLEHPGLSVNFSLDSFFEDENDAVRGRGYHARALGNLRALLAARGTSGAASPRITIQVTLTRVNLGRLEESLLRLAELGVDSILLERMRAFAWQPERVRGLAPAPAEWIDGAARLARASRRIGAAPVVLLNYGNARLKAALAERYGFSMPAARACPGGLQAAVLDAGGELHPCRLARIRRPPLKACGSPWYEVHPVAIADEAAGRFLATPYFVDFFNFAHSATVYEGLSLCRACPHYQDCGPCPLDVVARGEAVLAECRELIRGGLP